MITILPKDCLTDAKGNKLPYVFTYNEVYKAYEDCRKHKGHTANAMKFSQSELANITKLTDDINQGLYEIGYSIAFIVTYPVYREVFAADFRDRIVHHLVINEMLPLFEQTFIANSYSCRKKKGVLCGVKHVFQMVEECTEQYTRDAWVLKMDIKSFFMSIDKERLADMVDQLIEEKYTNPRKKQMLRALFQQIILHRPELKCERRGNTKLWERLPVGKSLFERDGDTGLPIGNLTSQVLANVYLTPFDNFVMKELGFQYYGRYVDDFVIISTDREALKRAVPRLEKFLKEELGLDLHPNKRYIQHYTKGIPFTGAIIKKDRTYIINRTKGALYYKIKTKFSVASEEKLDQFINVVNSYLGFMKHHKTYRLRKAILTDEKLMGHWMPFIIIASDYCSIKRKFKKSKEKATCL